MTSRCSMHADPYPPGVWTSQVCHLFPLVRASSHLSRLPYRVHVSSLGSQPRKNSTSSLGHSFKTQETEELLKVLGEWSTQVTKGFYIILLLGELVKTSNWCLKADKLHKLSLFLIGNRLDCFGTFKPTDELALWGFVYFQTVFQKMD